MKPKVDRVGVSAEVEAPFLRAIGPGVDLAPIPSPAHSLQAAIEKGYAAPRHNRLLSTGIFVISLICVYALAAFALGLPLSA